MSIHPPLFATAAMLGLVGVLAGTFGAHGLKGRITTELLETFEIGVRYNLVHAAALLAVATLAADTSRRIVRVAGWLFVAGIVVFSGTLYALAITGAKWLGMITPFGGVCFILGWVSLAWFARSLPQPLPDSK